LEWIYCLIFVGRYLSQQSEKAIIPLQISLEEAEQSVEFLEAEICGYVERDVNHEEKADEVVSVSILSTYNTSDLTKNVPIEGELNLLSMNGLECSPIKFKQDLQPLVPACPRSINF